MGCGRTLPRDQRRRCAGRGGLGFEAEDNALSLFWPGGEEALPRASKRTLAQQLIVKLAERYRAQRG